MRQRAEQKLPRIIYKPPGEITDDMERGIDRVFDLLFEEVVRVQELQKQNYNEYECTRISK